MSKIFLEVVVAPGFTDEAQEILSQKKNLRLIQWNHPKFLQMDVRSALGGWLVQTRDTPTIPKESKVVTRCSVRDSQWGDLHFAWIVAKHVKSNAIVVAKDGVTLGIGAGQMSRVDAVRIALEKSNSFHRKGAVLASDAFFPFRDNIELLKGTGIEAVIQPGGSQRDPEVIAACDELGIAMALMGERHFRH
jgi:phosphoribosylaminoimidazolecarboxamide formyltransferase/IMP cyclohydrolase